MRAGITSSPSSSLPSVGGATRRDQRRLEADRFAIVTRESDVLGRGEQLLEEIRTRRFEVDSTTVRVTASAGAHRVDPNGGLDAERALHVQQLDLQTKSYAVNLFPLVRMGRPEH